MNKGKNSSLNNKDRNELTRTMSNAILAGQFSEKHQMNPKHKTHGSSFASVDSRPFQLQFFLIAEPCLLEQIMLIPHGQIIPNFSQIQPWLPHAHPLPTLLGLIS